jgi:hypothetical protein
MMGALSGVRSMRSLVSAGMAIALVSACSSGAALDQGPAGTCAAGAQAACQGSVLSYCDNSGNIAEVDCSSLRQECATDGAGVGACVARTCQSSRPRTCAGDVLSFCDGEIARSVDCRQYGETCGYTTENVADCTEPCPADVDALGKCVGPVLERCDGQVYLDYDCSNGGDICGVDASGAASCGTPCPPGTSQFGSCNGTILTGCSGDFYYQVDCSASGQACAEATRFGGACVGCGATPASQCAGDLLSACSPSGFPSHTNCAASGATCSADPSGCELTCVGGTGGRTCVAEGLTPGMSLCKTSSYTGFASIVTCLADGTVSETECPAAGDGSVVCSTDSGQPACVSTGPCDPSGYRCTDRGVLVECGAATGLPWTDCLYYGATCQDDGTDAYCACTTLPASLDGCVAGQQATCTAGRLELSPCSC